ncbi:MAG TPA: ABC transporter permease [Blastocatellia bacterium]
MSLQEKLRRLIKPLLPRRRFRREIDEELRIHLEMQIEENVEAGMSREDARRAALRRFGNFESIRETCHEISETRTESFFSALSRDLQYGFRYLRKHTAFTVVAIFTLALGSGASTAIFSVVNSVLLRPLPYDHPERLVMIWEKNPRGIVEGNVSPPNFYDWKAQSQIFEQMAALSDKGFNLVTANEPERVEGQETTDNLFDLLGAKPLLGRTFLPGEDRPGNNRVVLLSYELWQRRFGSDPAAVGQSVSLNGNDYTVVGVMPRGFLFPSKGVEIWTPFTFDAQIYPRNNRFLSVIGRLSAGANLAQAQAEMQTIAARIEQENPKTNSGYGVTLIPLHEQVTGRIRLALLVLLGAVGLVMLVACANVAGLLLARSSARHREMALRAALGAGRFRLIRQLLTESALLSLIGSVFGIGLAHLGIRLLVSLAPADIPRLDEAGIDLKALGFTLALAAVTSVLFGLAPAVQWSKVNLSESLRESGAAAGTSRQRIRSLLVVAEIALSMALLAGAGLMIRSFLRLQQVDPGFDSKNVLTAQITLPTSKYKERSDQAAFFGAAILRIERLPGVESVGLTSNLPLTPPVGLSRFGFSIEGRELAEGQSDRAYIRWISPNYFQAIGIPLLAGRDFTERDNMDSAGVVIIDATLARRFFADENPIGKRLRLSYSAKISREIIGVVGEVKQTAMDAPADPHIYVPFLQERTASMYLAARTASDPESFISAVRNEILAIDREQPIYQVQTMEGRISGMTAPRRFNMLLLGTFALTALLLAAVGIYGVVAYTVSQREREIGIRLAMGARSTDVIKLIAGRGVGLALAGVVAGLALSFALTRLMTGLLYEVSPTDTATFAIISIILALAAMIAAYLPARRAGKIDPMRALRYE